MKKLPFLIVLILGAGTVFCQSTENSKRYQAVLFDFGADYTHASIQMLSKWTHETHQLSPFQGISAHVSVSYLTRHFDYGLILVFPNPNRITAFYAGRRLTHLSSPVSSFINLEFGAFNAVYTHLKPMNSRSSAMDSGKTKQLQFNNGFIGLSSKNYFSHLNIKNNSFVIGLEAMAGYFPSDGNWRYGYRVYSGKTSTFISHRVHGIPYPGKWFFNAGIVIGFAGKIGS